MSQLTVHPVVTRVFSRGIGILLLAIWCVITGAIGIGIPLGALAPILNWLLLIAGLLIIFGI